MPPTQTLPTTDYRLPTPQYTFLNRLYNIVTTTDAELMSPAEQLQRSQGTRTERRWTLAIIVTAVALRIGFALATPAWNSPDEYPHYWVADQIAVTGEFPDHSPNFPRYEAFQPPLHYIVAAGLLRATGGEGKVPEFRDSTAFPPPAAEATPSSLITLRLLSVLFALLTLLIVRQTLKGLTTLNSFERIGSLAFVAFLPTYVGLTSTVNNDAPVILISAAAIHYAVKKRATRRDIFLAGLAVGLALLAKTSAVIILPLFLFLLVRSYRAAQRGEGSFIADLLLSVAGASIGLIPLLLRNLLQYHSLTAIMPTAERRFAADPANIAQAVRNLFWSFWVAFGRTYDIRPADLFYPLLFLPLSLLALVGLLRAFRRHGGLVQPALAALLFGVVVSVGFALSFPPGDMTCWGKNLYPLLPLIAPLVLIGWNNVAGRDRHMPAVVGISLLLLFSLWGLGRMMMQ